MTARRSAMSPVTGMTASAAADLAAATSLPSGAAGGMASAAATSRKNQVQASGEGAGRSRHPLRRAGGDLRSLMYRARPRGSIRAGRACPSMAVMVLADRGIASSSRPASSHGWRASRRSAQRPPRRLGTGAPLPGRGHCGGLPGDGHAAPSTRASARGARSAAVPAGRRGGGARLVEDRDPAGQPGPPRGGAQRAGGLRDPVRCAGQPVAGGGARRADGAGPGRRHERREGQPGAGSDSSAPGGGGQDLAERRVMLFLAATAALATSARAAVSSRGAAGRPPAPAFRWSEQVGDGNGGPGPPGRDPGQVVVVSLAVQLAPRVVAQGGQEQGRARSLAAQARARAIARAREVAVPEVVCSRRRLACMPGSARTSRSANRWARPRPGRAIGPGPPSRRAARPWRRPGRRGR